MRWHGTVTAALVGSIVSATMIGGHAPRREWEDDRVETRRDSTAPASARSTPAATGAPVTRSTAAAGSVSGRIVLLGASAAEGGRVSDAVVYLEPIAVARPAPRPAPEPPRAAPPPNASAAPRDSVRLLWGATRELGQAVREMRDALSGLRTALVGGRTNAPPVPSASLPTVAAIDEAGRPAAPPAPPARSVVVDEAPALPVPVVTRVDMAMQRKEFRPHVRVVGVGSAVEWPNKDPFSHNVFSNTPGGAFDLGLYPRGESRDAAFRRPGVYEIFCNIHPRMSAFVVAVPSPYHAQPSGDGRFTLGDVVPGRYRLRVWHERAREQTQIVTVDAGGMRDVQLTLDARAYRPTAHANKFGHPYATTGRDEY